ncbi:MAG TPA: ESX secretion-associated protein EspG [Amycolatopsis sp.]|nr:ESX secretion-associated protein EspG [Amycolatopsis sp.]
MIRLSASAFDVVWTDLGLGPVPVPLAVPSVGATVEEREAIRAEVYRGLGERGLFDGRLAPELEHRLRVLGSATRYVTCEALADMTADTPFRAVAAARGRSAVVAVQPERTVGLREIGESELASSIVGLLPLLSAGLGHGVTLPASGWDHGSPARARQADELATIQERPVFAAGQFTAYTRAARGPLTRLGGLTWFDTDAGAYTTTLTASRGDQPWVTVSPADSARLAQRVLDLFD